MYLLIVTDPPLSFAIKNLSGSLRFIFFALRFALLLLMILWWGRGWWRGGGGRGGTRNFSKFVFAFKCGEIIRYVLENSRIIEMTFLLQPTKFVTFIGDRVYYISSLSFVSCHLSSTFPNIIYSLKHRIVFLP